ncbi:MAG TPA: DUF411 domain-containing protein [Candidatus Binatia bacterium]|nr:DUF411 domain-containing protein [Candidatus Binatia bacterium]
MKNKTLWLMVGFLFMLGFLFIGLMAAQRAYPQSRAHRATTITVYADYNCQCCSEWIKYMKRHGFHVNRMNLNRDQLQDFKNKIGVPTRLRSCHTALAGKYAIEGHIPVEYISALLASNSEIAGITLPGMPDGSPGMEHPGGHKEKLLVYWFSKDGKSALWTPAKVN